MLSIYHTSAFGRRVGCVVLDVRPVVADLRVGAARLQNFGAVSEVLFQGREQILASAKSSRHDHVLRQRLFVSMWQPLGGSVQPYLGLDSFLEFDCSHLVIDHGADLCNDWIKGGPNIACRECNFWHLERCLRGAEVDALHRHVEGPRPLLAIEGRLDTVFPLIVQKATKTLRFQLGPCFVAKLLFENLEEGFINKDGTAETT